MNVPGKILSVCAMSANSKDKSTTALILKLLTKRERGRGSDCSTSHPRQKHSIPIQ